MSDRRRAGMPQEEEDAGTLKFGPGKLTLMLYPFVRPGYIDGCMTDTLGRVPRRRLHVSGPSPLHPGNVPGPHARGKGRKRHLKVSLVSVSHIYV